MDNDMQVETLTSPDPAGKKSGKRAVTIGLAAGLLGGTAAGLVFGVPGFSSAASPSGVVQQVDEPTTDPATTDPTTTDPTTTDQATTDAATPADPAVDEATRDAEAGTRLREVLQPLVDDGTITAEQADAVTAHLIENRPERPEGGFGGGPGGHGGHGPFGHFLGEASDAVTTLLGIDADALRQQLQDGSSLADIATANGVEPQAVIDLLVAEATTQIDQAVTDGKIDADKAAEITTNLVDRVTDMVNGVRPAGGDFPGGRGGPGAPDAPADDVPVTTEN